LALNYVLLTLLLVKFASFSFKLTSSYFITLFTFQSPLFVRSLERRLSYHLCCFMSTLFYWHFLPSSRNFTSFRFKRRISDSFNTIPSIPQQIQTASQAYFGITPGLSVNI